MRAVNFILCAVCVVTIIMPESGVIKAEEEIASSTFMETKSSKQKKTASDDGENAFADTEVDDHEAKNRTEPVDTAAKDVIKEISDIEKDKEGINKSSSAAPIRPTKSKDTAEDTEDIMASITQEKGKGWMTGCETVSCSADQICVLDEKTEKEQCRCKPGFTGSNCKKEITSCTNDTCLSGGLCVPQEDGFVCVCANDQITGKYCEKRKGTFAAGGRSAGPNRSSAQQKTESSNANWCARASPLLVFAFHLVSVSKFTSH